MRTTISSYLSGLLFGIGLIVSGMSEPTTVLGFFDVFGAWNPSLAFVMAGGLAVTALGYRWCLTRPNPVCTKMFQRPTRTEIDARLLAGAALFGLGWGLAGYCPGPAMIATAGGFTEAALFTAAMLAGMLAWKLVEQGLEARRTVQAMG
jgi:uncharacterized membrane protein YedE/YeeE